MPSVGQAADTRVSSVTISFSSQAYGLDAVKKAAYRFADAGAPEIIPDGNQILCKLSFHEAKSEAEAERIANDLRLEVLDQDLRHVIADETGSTTLAAQLLMNFMGFIFEERRQKLGSCL